MENRIEELLIDVAKISKKYEEKAQSTGENFNIFKILNVSTSEVRLHSNLIAELLNPIGNHGLKNKFLNLFIQNIIEKDKYDFDLTQSDKAIVEIEVWVGNICTESDTGGYIDIIIKLPDNPVIIIENKIYAGDQENQLRRYYNSNKNAKLIYLTLDGIEADDYTTANSKYPDEVINPICISYQTDIKAWLEQCIDKANNHPILRETIRQYIYLINHLTNQTMNDEMKREIIDILNKNPEFVKSARLISEAWEHYRKVNIVNQLENELKEVAKKLELEIEIDSPFGKIGEGFWFFKNDWKDTCIFYKFESGERNLWAIIYNREKNKAIHSEYFKEWDETPWSEKLNIIPQAVKEKTEYLLGIHKLSEK